MIMLIFAILLIAIVNFLLLIRSIIKSIYIFFNKLSDTCIHKKEKRKKKESEDLRLEDLQDCIIVKHNKRRNTLELIDPTELGDTFEIVKKRRRR